MTDLDFKAMAHDVLRTAGLGHNEDYGYSDADIPPVALVLERDHFAPAIADARRDALSAVVRDLHLLADAWEANLHEGGPDPWHILHGCANDLREHASAIAQKTDAPDSWRGDDEEVLRLAEALMVGGKSVVVEECGELVQVYLGPSHQRLADALLSAKAKGRREALDEPLVATAVRFAAAIAEHEECACPTTETTCVHFDRMADAEVAYCAARAGAIAVPLATGEDGDLRARVLAFADLVERKRCRAWQPGEVAWRLRAWIDGDEAPEMRRGATGEDGDREEPHVFKRRNKK